MRLLRTLAISSIAAVGDIAHAADFYGEFHAGTSRVEHQNAAITGEERVEGAYGIGVGVRYNEYFSTQLDWHTLGENPYIPPAACPIPPCPIIITLLPFPEHAWVLRAIPRLPIGDSFAVELGIGLAAWEGDQDVSGTMFEDSGTDLWCSFGLEWRFAERWSATVEMQKLDHEWLEFEWTGATLRYRF